MWRVWIKQWPKYLTLWPAGLVLRITFVQYLIAFCSRTEVTSDVISDRILRSVVPDKGVKFGDPRLNCSLEIPPEAVLGGIFYGFFAVASDRK